MTYEQNIPVKRLFPLHDRRVLHEDSAHVIGGVPSDAVIDARGTIFIADFMMREVKAFDRQGSFLGVVGGQGQGPGEYVGPVSVSLSSSEDTLAVADINLSRIVMFDATSFATISTHRITSPISVRTMRLGAENQMVVAGTPHNYSSDSLAYVAALLTLGTDSVVRAMVPIPSRLRKRAMGGSVLSGRADRTKQLIFAALSGSATVWRLSKDGRGIDSISLPKEMLEEAALPRISEWHGDIRAMQEFIKTQSWMSSIVAVDDSTSVLEATSFSPVAEDWESMLMLVEWNDPPEVRGAVPCKCTLLASHGDTIAVLTGGPPRPYAVEWRNISRRDSRVSGRVDD